MSLPAVTRRNGLAHATDREVLPGAGDNDRDDGRVGRGGIKPSEKIVEHLFRPGVRLPRPVVPQHAHPVVADMALHWLG